MPETLGTSPKAGKCRDDTGMQMSAFRWYWRFSNALPPAPGEVANRDAHYQRMMARCAVRKTGEIEAAMGYELTVGGEGPPTRSATCLHLSPSASASVP